MSDPVKFAQALKGLQEAMKAPSYVEHMRLVAEHHFARFMAFKKAGFSAAEALELVIRKAD